MFVGQAFNENFHCSIDVSDFEFHSVFPFKTPLCVDVKFKKSLDAVMMDAEVSFDFCQPCDRCGCEVLKHLNYKFNHKLVPFKENNLDDDDYDYIVLDDYKLDLDELIVSDVILELPSKILCKLDCRGLCVKCGKNLNEGSCSCTFNNIDPRLEALKNLIH